MNKPDLFYKIKYNAVTPEEVCFFIEDQMKLSFVDAEINKDDLEELEEIIKTHPYWAYRYAKKVLRSRWKAAEKTIMKSPMWAAHYARRVMYTDWPEAEDTIRQNKKAWKYYIHGTHNYI